MGLLAERPVLRLDLATLREGLQPLEDAGIGRLAMWTLDETDPEALAASLDRIYEHLEESPHPDSEWSTLERVLEGPRLERLMHVSHSSLRRYSGRQRDTPTDVAGRLHFLARIVAHLMGGYNTYGIRRWFERKREQLDGATPTEVLSGDWNPDDDPAQIVLDLARRMNSSPAT